jgi:hypothetical protein
MYQSDVVKQIQNNKRKVANVTANRKVNLIKTKVLALNAEFGVDIDTVKDLINATKVKAVKTDSDLASILRSAIHIYEEENELGRAQYDFYEVTGDVQVTALLLQYSHFGYALTINKMQLGQLGLATDTIEFIDSIRLHMHMGLKQHRILDSILKRYAVDTKPIDSDGLKMLKMANRYGQRLVVNAYKVIDKALTTKWD